MRIRFLSDQVYETGGPGKGPHFPKGFVLDESGVKDALGLRDEPDEAWKRAFLHRWVQRKVAEEVDGRTPLTADAAAEADAAATRKRDAEAAAKAKAEKDAADTKAKAEADARKAAEQVKKTDLAALTRAELDAIAEKRGVDITGAKNKAEVIAALEAATLGDD